MPGSVCPLTGEMSGFPTPTPSNPVLNPGATSLTAPNLTAPRAFSRILGSMCSSCADVWPSTCRSICSRSVSGCTFMCKQLVSLRCHVPFYGEGQQCKGDAPGVAGLWDRGQKASRSSGEHPLHQIVTIQQAGGVNCTLLNLICSVASYHIFKQWPLGKEAMSRLRTERGKKKKKKRWDKALRGGCLDWCLHKSKVQCLATFVNQTKSNHGHYKHSAPVRL